MILSCGRRQGGAGFAGLTGGDIREGNNNERSANRQSTLDLVGNVAKEADEPIDGSIRATGLIAHKQTREAKCTSVATGRTTHIPVK